jgi:AcrR family transcriptional regulator
MSERRPVRSDGERSRAQILEVATRLATVEGIYGVSLSRVARDAGMSKSGVFGLYGSKEELQLAIVRAARRVFVRKVVMPALDLPQGVVQLRALVGNYLTYVQDRTWPGGCFFASIASEVSGRPGPIRDLVVENQTAWGALFQHNARVALDQEQLSTTLEPDQLAASLTSMLTGADIAFLLQEDAAVLDRVRGALEAQLAS